MRILVLCPMDIEAQNFKNAISCVRFPKNKYKIVTTGVGKAFAAAATALEATAKDYDVVAVIGYAAGHGYNLNDFVIPLQAAYHDVNAPAELCPELTKIYQLNGVDDAIILTGDSFITKDNYQFIIAKFPGKKILFDMEATAVCQIIEDYCPDTNVIVLKLISDIPSQDTSFTEFVETHSDFSQFVYYLEELK